MKMLFAHLADCHLGCWRDQKMRQMHHDCFCEAIDRIIAEKCEFAIIAGDLFHAAVPGMDAIRLAFEQLRRLRDAGISTYFVAGSHDFSPTGQSILDVIEAAGLGTDVSRGEVVEGKLRLAPVRHKDTLLCGIAGRHGGLDINAYKELDRQWLEALPSPKIFIFHAAIAEMKPEDMLMEAMPASLLPAGFDYYAGGHVHVVAEHEKKVFPGPVFPATIAELEKLQGGFCLVRDFRAERILLGKSKVMSINVDVSGMSSAQAEAAISKAVPAKSDGIVLVRASGKLAEGMPSDIRFDEVLGRVEAAAIVRSTAGIEAPEQEETRIQASTLEEIEDKLTKEFTGKSTLFNDEARLARQLMQALAAEKAEGERTTDFEQRVIKETTVLF